MITLPSMTKGQLLEALRDAPDDAPVALAWDYGALALMDFEVEYVADEEHARHSGLPQGWVVISPLPEEEIDWERYAPPEPVFGRDHDNERGERS